MPAETKNPMLDDDEEGSLLAGLSLGDIHYDSLKRVLVDMDVTPPAADEAEVGMG